MPRIAADAIWSRCTSSLSERGVLGTLTAEHAAPKMETKDNCNLCSERGEVLYSSLRDRLFGIGDDWNFSECPSCGLVWLNPRPTVEHIAGAYAGYYTHQRGDSDTLSWLPLQQEKVKRAILSECFLYSGLSLSRHEREVAPILAHMPSLRDYVGRKVMFLEDLPDRDLLDVGCGNGEFLARMTELGWSGLGTETDERAVTMAREATGLTIVNGALEEAGFSADSFNAVTLNHVIEHVHEPAKLLEEAFRILKPGGKLVILTPNIDSLGHRFFGRRWRGLEPPRHLYLYSMETLSKCVSKTSFLILEQRTVSPLALAIWIASMTRFPEKSRGPSRLVVMLGLTFYALEELLKSIVYDAGEELLLIAVKRV